HAGARIFSRTPARGNRLPRAAQVRGRTGAPALQRWSPRTVHPWQPNKTVGASTRVVAAPIAAARRAAGRCTAEGGCATWPVDRSATFLRSLGILREPPTGPARLRLGL